MSKLQFPITFICNAPNVIDFCLFVKENSRPHLVRPPQHRVNMPC
ncbi:MAG: hypothetical protein VE96_C0006G0009 [candidate division Kazan bacterium GW2011_GWA1_44_22]|uniref:Uncharacterized protein n=1 Tax=candidate division Kazan bacterium GW2011_GWA1_44_22 TaxID=1620410 RepID=A0A0G1K9G7_UNCK3|nr:MAG: hypothetical protein VE96_C0006G0009 [candidate division Kazan bacterium GW2011_GWA1_44_22]